MAVIINGKVVESGTDKTLAGLRVEAWDKGSVVDDYLEFTISEEDGTFTFALDESDIEDWFSDRSFDIYFKVFRSGEILASTEDSVSWNIKKQNDKMIVKIPSLKTEVCGEQNVFLKIERIDHYSPVMPQDDHTVSSVEYGRDCMRNEGHENGFIPQSEIDARSLSAVVYREYLDSAYLIPKPDKLILADINEPLYDHRVPGTVIYTRPCRRLKIHVWNCDEIPHSLHVHGLSYGIDSDGSWPLGTEAAHHGGRSDAICAGESWTYTFDVSDEMLGPWPFHDHTHHMDMRIDHGLFGGIVVLAKHDKPPRRFRFRKGMLIKIYKDLEQSEGKKFFPKGYPDLDSDPAPFILKPYIHVKRLKEETKQLVEDHVDFLEEFLAMELSKRRKRTPTDHVPVFFHLISSNENRPVFDEELDRFLTLPAPSVDLPFATAGDYEYFCRHHPEMNGIIRVVPGGPQTRTVIIQGMPVMGFDPSDVTVGVGGHVLWENHDSMNQHTVTSKQGAAMPTHCINGRGFVGNSPTIVGRAGQRIRWYVFNLDTSMNWHNFHPHGMRWKFGGQNIDIRSIGPAESFIVEAKFPPVLLLTEDQERIQDSKHRPKDAKLFHLKGDFVFHCHVHHHMMNGMIGLVRSRQSVWLTPDMAHEISHLTGLPLDDGGNQCPDVDPHPCAMHGGGHWEQIPGDPQVLMMHSVLLPNTKRVLYWGRTRSDQSRIWDYSTATGVYMSPGNQPADFTGGNVDTSNMWSAEHALLNTSQGDVLIHGGFSPNRTYTFNPTTLSWSLVNDTQHDRFYSTTLVVPDGRAVTLFGSASKSIEIYTHGTGWSAPITMPASMNHHVFYPWTYVLPDGRLFIAGPHVPTQRFNFPVPGTVESISTIAGDRSTGGEKGSSIMLMLRPPDYKPIVYIMGGDSLAAQNTSEQIDLSAPNPSWTSLPPLKVSRPLQFTATLLPDGRIFIAGGVVGGADGGPCEIYDPRNPAAEWVLGPNMQFVRTYHSSFILLQDGSILGGGAPPDSDPPSVYTAHERFYPEYFDMLRPIISNAPPTINYSSNFTINTPTPPDISEVVLLRPGAVTHGYNMSQRGIECVIAGTGPGTLDVEAPPNSRLAPPGWHLLFILDSNRVPSEGRWVRLT